MLGGIEYEADDLFNGPTVQVRYIIFGVEHTAQLTALTRIRIKKQ